MKGGEDIAEDEEMCYLYQMNHADCYGASYGVVNKTDNPIILELDLTGSNETFFTPSEGKVTMTIAPKTLKFLAAAISDPNSDEVGFEHKYTV